MFYSIKYSQVESGLAGLHLLEDIHVFISWLTPTWLMPLRQFLYLHSITITLTDCWHIPLCCEHDQYLMEPALSDHSLPSLTTNISTVSVCISKLLPCLTSPMEMTELSTRPSWLVNDQLTASILEPPGLKNQQ
jgi:hypothetical protein